jgi:hypothetical protein
LTGAEDIPVAAGDTVYVGPGVYREKLTVDVSGAAGTPIIYIGDVTGCYTDGIGGLVRWTGSADDIALTRDHCIEATSKNYRSFRGFMLDMCSSHVLHITTGALFWTIQDCWVACGLLDGLYLTCVAADVPGHEIERCWFWGAYNLNYGIRFSGATQKTDNEVRNCVFMGDPYCGVGVLGAGGTDISDCYFQMDTLYSVRATSLPAGYTAATAKNCVLVGGTSFYAATLGFLLEDHNSINSAAGLNVAAGANSDTAMPLFEMPALEPGYVLPWRPLGATVGHATSAVARALFGTMDIYGVTRTATAAKNSRGPTAHRFIARDVTTVRTVGGASLKLPDCGRHQMWIPITAVSTTITVYVYREANYAGTNPQMIIKQPGQADLTITDAGPAGTWNALTHTWVPAAVPTYVVVELVSGNTAVAGNYAVYFDDLGVT